MVPGWPKRKLAGAFFVDIGLNPDVGGIDQGEDRIAGLDHVPVSAWRATTTAS
jgi:hypothetical protein